jgi:hypothetical protein
VTAFAGLLKVVEIDPYWADFIRIGIEKMKTTKPFTLSNFHCCFGWCQRVESNH